MTSTARVASLALGCLCLTATHCSGQGDRTSPQKSDPKMPPPVASVRSQPAAAKEGTPTMAFQITSTAFTEGAPIPVRHTCDDKDLSPALAWAGAPQGTKSFALICDDPDAPIGTWVHWVVFNIPADSAGLPEGVPAVEKLPNGTIQGKNGWHKIGYGGPCPPPGKPHRYFFKLYALDTLLALDSSADKKAVLNAVKGHALGEAQWMGTYARKR